MESKRVIEIDLSLSYSMKEEAPKVKEQESFPQGPKRITQSQPLKEEKVIQKKEIEPIQETPKMENMPTVPVKGEEGYEEKPIEAPQAVGTQEKATDLKESSGISQGDVPNNSKDTTRTVARIIDKRQSQELYLREKLSIISSIVQKHISYPLLARRMGWEGRVVVCFILHPDGRIENLHVEKSSGYEILDKNALDTVKRVANLFPAPPVEVLVKLPVNYKLE